MYDFSLEDLQSSTQYQQASLDERVAVSRQYVSRNGPDEALRQLDEIQASEQFNALSLEDQDSFNKKYFHFYGLNTSEQDSPDSDFATDSKDVIYSVLAGTSTLPRAVSTIAGWLGFEEGKERLLDIAKTTEEFYSSKISEHGKGVQQESFLSDIDGQWFGDNVVKKVFMTSAESLPLMVATAPVGGAASAVLKQAKFLPGVVRGVQEAGRSGKWTHNLLTYGASEAGTSALVSAADAGTRIAEMSEEELMKSPVYQELIKNLPPDVARDALRGAVEEETFKTQAIATLIGDMASPGGAMPKLFQKAGKGNIIKETLWGMIEEGFQEAGQSGTETVADNYLEQNWMDPDRQLLQDLAENMALGGAAGVLMGAGMGGGSKLLSPKELDQIANDIPIDASPEDVVAVIEEHSQPDPEVEPINITTPQEVLTEEDQLQLAEFAQMLPNMSDEEVLRFHGRLDEAREKRPLVAQKLEEILAPRLANIHPGDPQQEEQVVVQEFKNTPQQSTPEESAKVFETEPPTPQMLEAERVGKRKEDLTAAFGDKNALLPRGVADAISKMEYDLQQGTENGVTLEGSGQDTQVTGVFPSTNPQWFKNAEIKRYDQEHGTSFAGQVTRRSILSALDKVRNNQELTTQREKASWDYMQRAAEIEAQNDPELVANREFQRLEEEGFEFKEPSHKVVGSLEKGDQVVVLDNQGVPDKLTHKGRNENGDIVLQDGVTMNVDEFDVLPEVIAEKKGGGVEPAQAQEKETGPIKAGPGPETTDGDSPNGIGESVQTEGKGEQVSEGGDKQPSVSSSETVDSPESIAHGQEVNTNPTEDQKKAGNYKKAHKKIDGLDLSIENPTGSTRSGVDKDGREWSVELKNDYGYIKGSKGYDKDHVDVFIAPNYEGGSEFAYIINQHNQDGSFDEHKIVIGAKSDSDALDIYNANYEEGWTGGKSISRMKMKSFKRWVTGSGPSKGEYRRQSTVETHSLETKPVDTKKSENTKEKESKQHKNGIAWAKKKIADPKYKKDAKELYEHAKNHQKANTDFWQGVLAEAQRQINEKEVIESTPPPQNQTEEQVAEETPPDKGTPEPAGSQPVSGEEQPVDAEAFVKAPNGSEVFGEISPDVAKQIRRQSGKIKMQVGRDDNQGRFGLNHISRKHGREIEDPVAFVHDIAKNYNEIWRADAGQLLLVKKNGRDLVSFIQLKPGSESDFYTVNTAYRARRHRGKELLWSAADHQSVTPGEQPDFANTPEVKSGQEAPNTVSESNSTNSIDNITSKEGEGKVAGKPRDKESKESRSPKKRTEQTLSEKGIKSELLRHITADRLKELTTSGKVNIISPDEYLSKESLPSGAINKQTQAVTREGKVYLLTGRIQKGDAWQVLLHEFGDHLEQLTLEDHAYNNVLKAVGRSLNRKSKLGDELREAQKRIPEGTPPEHVNRELLAYLIENNRNEVSFIRVAIARIKKLLVERMGISAKVFSSDDFKALAVHAVRGGSRNKMGRGEDGQTYGWGLYSIKAPFGDTVAADRIESLADKHPKWGDRWERFIYEVVDKDDPRRRVYERGQRKNAKTDILTVERLRGKKTADEIEQFMNKDLEPLLKHLAESDLGTRDLEEFAYALHVPERNHRMQQVNAKGYIDNIRKNLNTEETRELDNELVWMRSDHLVSGGSRSQLHDQYLEVLDRLFGDISTMQSDLDDQQAEHDVREWTDDEIAKGTPERLQARLDNRQKKIDAIRELKDRWDTESPRYAGITNEEAWDILDKWEDDERIADLQEANNRLAAINQKKLDILFESGQLSKAEYDSMVSGYEHYVPLHRDIEEGKDFRPAIGRPTGPLGHPLKVAKGSMADVVHILAHSVRNTQAAINRKHRAEAGKILLNFAHLNPEAGITVGKQKKKATHDSEGNIVMYESPVEDNDNELYVRVNGERYTLTFNTKDKTVQRFLESIKDADVGLNGPLKYANKATRFLATVNTSLSPEFIFSNFWRDIQTAGINMADSDAKGMQAKVLKNVFPAIKGIWMAEYGKENSYWGRSYRDFAKNGGKIGWMQTYGEIQDLADEIQHTFDLHSDGHIRKKSFHHIKNLVSRSNLAVENGVRLATYDQLVKAGVSKSKAALTAANLTVDFTRRGKSSPILNSLYMFFNAGVQGNYRIIKALGRSKKVQALTGAIVLSGFLGQMLAYMFGGEDDSGEPKIHGLPSYITERNMVFWFPGQEQPFKLPMPYGYNVFYNIGNEIARAAYSNYSGRKYNPSKGALRLANSAMGSLNPLHSATLLQTFVPTLGDPLAMIGENTTWAGTPLMPSKNPYGESKSDSYRYWKSASSVSKGIAKWLNENTGGEGQYQPGWIDISPETIELVYDTFSGSAGRFVKNSITTPIDYLKGEQIEPNRIPFVRRFYGGYTDRQISTRYYDKISEIKKLELNFKAAGSPGEKREFRKDPLFKLRKQARAYEGRIRKLRSAKQKLESKGRDIDHLKERIKALQVKFLKLADQVNEE